MSLNKFKASKLGDKHTEEEEAKKELKKVEKNEVKSNKSKK